jgi:hypothetical protein
VSYPTDNERQDEKAQRSSIEKRFMLQVDNIKFAPAYLPEEREEPPGIPVKASVYHETIGIKDFRMQRKSTLILQS